MSLAEMALWGSGCHSSVSLSTMKHPANTNSHGFLGQQGSCIAGSYQRPWADREGPVDDSGFVMGGVLRNDLGRAMQNARDRR